MGTLYLVATPIGNLEDITLRALRILGEVALIAAEDTRSARLLLKHHGVDAPRVTSYNEHNMRGKTPSILRALAEGDVAVVSDAGMPGISDPGHELVLAAIEAGHDVVPVPGASAVLGAVAASGLASRRFHYLGFLPRQSGPRKRALLEAAASGDTLVIFESPHRVAATLRDALAALGDRRVAVCREMTKRYEETWRGPISGALAHFTEPRGEFTLVIEGRTLPPTPLHPGGEGSPSPAELVAELRASAATSKEGIAELSRRFGLPRREAYRLWHKDAP